MRKQSVRIAITGLVVAAMCVPAFAAVDSFLSFEGAPGGKVQLTSVSHTSSLARDRKIGEIIVTKKVDSASPMLVQACASGKHIPMTIELASGGGAGKAVQRIEIKDAIVAAVHTSGAIETITLRYQQITVTWSDGGKTATDDWETR